MRVMVIVKASKESEAGVMPSTELLTAMGKFNEELAKAGIMISGDGLKPTSQGKRVEFSGNKRVVTDGPFAETKELIAGFWIWEVHSMDEALALPTEDAARLALRTQQVIAYESGVADTVDPCAGSYAIEELTTEIEQRVVDYLDKIEAVGGTLHAIESGYIQREIQNAAYEYQQAVEFGRKIAEAGFMVITGAGGGIMQAGHEGAGPENRRDHTRKRDRILNIFRFRIHQGCLLIHGNRTAVNSSNRTPDCRD